MRKYARHILACVLMLMPVLWSSCRRLPLYDESSLLRIDLDIDYTINHDAPFEKPTKMVAGFYNPFDATFVNSDIVGPKGGYIDIGPGLYDLIVYNFDSYGTHVRRQNDRNKIEAYTNEVMATERSLFDKAVKALAKAAGEDEDAAVKSYENQPVIYEPDQLFVARNVQVDIPLRDDTDPEFVIKSHAETFLKTYSLRIGLVEGSENVSSAYIYLTGQVGVKGIWDEDYRGEPSAIYFPININRETKHFYTTFNTFGKYPDEINKVFLVVEAPGGGRVQFEWDVTDQFDDETNTSLEIDIVTDIRIPTPEEGSGGFGGEVVDWDDHKTIIDL